MASVIFQHIVNRVAGGMAVNHYPFTGGTAQQLVQRHIGGFGFDVPQRHIDSRDRRHGDRATTPVRAFIEELPDIFDAVGITTNQLRAEMIFQV